MTLNDISQISQIIIALGTIFTAYYAFETSKKTTEIFSAQLKLNFFADYTKRYQEISLNFPQKIHDKDFDFEELEPEIKEKTLRYMRAYFDLSSEEYFLWKNKNIDNNVWEEWKSGIECAMSKTAFQKGWECIDTSYYDDFTVFIEDILENNNK